jgi:hypothetical protein
MSCEITTVALEQAYDDFLDMTVAEFVYYLQERGLDLEAVELEGLVAELTEQAVEEMAA